MKNKRIILYADGGSRGNPGPGGIGVILCDDKKKKVKELYRYLGDTTNNIAEYNAVIAGLEEALLLGAEEVVINLDSELVVKQLNGEYRVKDENMKTLFARVLEILRRFKSFEIIHIERSKNKEADRLVNKAINLAGLS